MDATQVVCREFQVNLGNINRLRLGEVEATLNTTERQ
jgi:hypothetical protein